MRPIAREMLRGEKRIVTAKPRRMLGDVAMMLLLMRHGDARMLVV
jgi:hypothetical protein